MKIIVCGAGQVGIGIARQLAAENNDVTVIDQSEELIDHVRDTLDVKGIVGFASHPNVLESAGAQQAEMLIAVTSSDEVNMVACQIGHSIFDIPTKIARVRNQHYLHPLWNDLYRKDHLPIDVIISPEIEVARAIVRRLHVPGALDMVPFVDGRVRLIAARCMLDCSLLGRNLDEIMAQAGGLQMTIAGVGRDTRFFMASEMDVLRANDDVYFLAAEKDVRRCMAFFGHEEKEAHKIVILGGGNIGLFLAQELEDDEHGYKLRVIEYSKDRAEHVADRLRRTTVVHGSAMDREILHEAHVHTAETLIAVTNDDKVNILAALLAKREGCERAISLVNNPSYNSLVSNLGIDAILSPRETTVSSILQHVRRGRIRGLHSLRNGVAEVVDAEVLPEAPLAGKSLYEADLPPGIAIAVIVREDEVLIPDEDTHILAGDHIIIVAKTRMVKKVEKLFAIRRDVF